MILLIILSLYLIMGRTTNGLENLMTEISYLTEENEYLNHKLSVLHQQNAALEAKQRDALKVVKECMELLRKEMKVFDSSFAE